jgi:hypothetical protein
MHNLKFIQFTVGTCKMIWFVVPNSNCFSLQAGSSWERLIYVESQVFSTAFFQVFFLRFSTILGNAKVWRLKFVCAPSSNVCRGLILCSIYNIVCFVVQNWLPPPKKKYSYIVQLWIVTRFVFLISDSSLISCPPFFCLLRLDNCNLLLDWFFFFGFSCTNNF